MKISCVFIVALIVAASCQQTTDVPDPDLDIEAPNTFDVSTAIISGFLNSDLVQKKLGILFNAIDLKIRLFRIIKSFLTRENLLMLRNILDFVVRACNFVIGFLPEPEPEPPKSFLGALFPVVQLNSPESPVVSDNVQRVNRDVNFTSQEQELFEKHKEDVIQVAKLIYNTP